MINKPAKNVYIYVESMYNIVVLYSYRDSNTFLP